MTLAEVCNELEEALEHEDRSRRTHFDCEREPHRDWWTMQRLLRALVALGDHELEGMWRRPLSARPLLASLERRDRMEAEDRFEALKVRAQEVLGGS